MGTVTMPGVDDNVLVLLDDVDDVESDTQLFGDPEGVIAFGPRAVLPADRLRVPFDAKARVEIDAFDLHTLIEDHARG